MDNNPASPNIAVFTSLENFQRQAEQLSKKLNCPCIENLSNDFDYILLLDEHGLQLKPMHDQSMQAICVDFVSGKSRHRRFHGGGELIAKACGAKGSVRPSICDLTAGLGRDAFVLAGMGCTVIMVERSPVVAALLEDGLQRLNESEINFELSLVHQDSKAYLQNLKNHPDVIYLDPMYPHRSKSALVKKEMRMLRDIVGADEDVEEVFELALSKAKKRIVVKRPNTADYLLAMTPVYSYKGKNSRFDIYAPVTNSQ